jgi:hypothetical protein
VAGRPKWQIGGVLGAPPIRGGRGFLSFLAKAAGQALASSRSRSIRSTNRSSITRASAVPTERIRSRYLWRKAGVLCSSAAKIVSIIVSHSPTSICNTLSIGERIGCLHDRAGYYSTTQSDYGCPRVADLSRNEA